MSVPKRVRFEVLRRDDHACRYCGARAPEAVLQVDHVVPVSLGGSDEPSNLVSACVDCNAGKSSTAPDQAVVADVDARAAAWVDAMRTAGDLLSERDAPKDNYVAAFRAEWDSWNTDQELPGSWEEIVGDLYTAQLPIARLVEAIRLTMQATNYVENEFAYFMACARRMLREQQNLARLLLDRGSTDGVA